MEQTLLAIVLAPLAAAIVAGLFGRVVGPRAPSWSAPQNGQPPVEPQKWSNMPASIRAAQPWWNG